MKFWPLQPVVGPVHYGDFLSPIAGGSKIRLSRYSSLSACYGSPRPFANCFTPSVQPLPPTLADTSYFFNACFDVFIRHRPSRLFVRAKTLPRRLFVFVVIASSNPKANANDHARPRSNCPLPPLLASHVRCRSTFQFTPNRRDEPSQKHSGIFTHTFKRGQ